MSSSSKRFLNRPLRIFISNASSKVVNSLLPLLCQGDVFGKDQPISLILFDFKPLIKYVELLTEDLAECCYPLLQSVTCTQDMSKAFQNIDIGILFELERDVIGFKNNAVLFRTYGLILNQVAPKDIKLLVVGQTANTSAFICSSFSPSLDPCNFTCLAHHLKLVAISKYKFEVSNKKVRCTKSLTEISNQQKNKICNTVDNIIPTLNATSISVDKGKPNSINDHDNKVLGCTETSSVDNINNDGDDDYDDDVYVWGSCSCPIVTIATHKNDVINLQHLNAETVAGMLVVAKAITEHLKYWLTDLSNIQQIIMGVINAKKHYNIDGNLFFNFPVRKINKNKSISIVDNINLNKNVAETLLECSKRMCTERDSAIVDCWRIVLPHSHL